MGWVIRSSETEGIGNEHLAWNRALSGHRAYGVGVHPTDDHPRFSQAPGAQALRATERLGTHRKVLYLDCDVGTLVSPPELKCNPFVILDLRGDAPATCWQPDATAQIPIPRREIVLDSGDSELARAIRRNEELARSAV